MQSTITPETASDKARPPTAPPLEMKPVTDVEAFLASLPKFTDEEVRAFEAAVRENRAQRRSSSEDRL